MTNGGFTEEQLSGSTGSTSGFSASSGIGTTSGTTSGITSGSGMPTGSGSISGTASASFAGNDENSELSITKRFYAIVKQNKEDYENAKTNYEDAVSNANLQLQILKLNLSSLQAAYEQAKSDTATSKISAQLTYETAIATADQAERDYETALQKAESEFDSVKTDKEDAESNLETFENSIGDGYFYASDSGTIVMVNCRAGGVLSCDSMVIAYSNKEDVSVTVSVDQADIASITVGEQAYVSISGYDGFDGTVTKINPVSSSSSKTSVTYEVTVSLAGDVSSLSANLTATVMFGMSSDRMPGGSPTNGQIVSSEL